jgi:DNA polymerase-3 subunit gamma/tau
MSYQVLARKYRPQKFSEVIGQAHVTQTLKNAIEQGRTAHGYIFSGHRGIGKTTVARILAMSLNCRSKDHPVAEPCGVCESCTEIRAGNSVDVIEIDAATNRGIDEIRELREAARYRPARDRFKIYILDEAHQITDAAFNALLKTLEEPPGHVVFMLATTQPEDIPQTIRSRCQHFSFRAVRFEQILQQLKDLAAKENIAADEDALALLAEAGDGSMRDALSIMDQAIASCEGRLTAQSVRQLVGAAPAGVLEEVMQAVSRGASEDVLRLVDKLISEGHNPTHFARQLVRFIRNALVAKVAGSDSPLLQISTDERTRVARVAELFSEEDLARHLQIMLRTHSELGYKQEQRFHLELGLLKMAHAERLLPIEQLLSEAGVQPATAPRSSLASSGARPITDARRSAAESTSRSGHVSPFAADSTRKGSPKQELSADPSVAVGPQLVPGLVMGAAAPATAPVREQVASTAADPQEGPDLRSAVLNALADHRMLVSMLESGEWRVEGNELVIKVAESATVIDMSLGADARRIATAAASGVLGRSVKIKVVSGGTRQAPPPREASNGSGRARAEQDPIVRRMKEKFGAEIRTIIDYREKR